MFSVSYANAGNKKNKRNKPEACPRLPKSPNSWKPLNLPQRLHFRSCKMPRYAFHKNARNNETKLSAQTSFIDKRIVQFRKGFCAAQALTKKGVVSRPLKIASL